MTGHVTVQRTASFSRDGRYRYALGRRWADGPAVTWVMLNPSTADARTDDPTVRRCIDFARCWGYGAIEVVNLFALRSTEPGALVADGDPVGPRGAAVLRRALGSGETVVAAWGNVPPRLAARADEVRRALPADTLCVGVTRSGQPRHPLYVAATTAPVPLAQALARGPE